MPDKLDYPMMVSALSKPGTSIMADLTPLKAERLHMAVGLVGEVFELQECIDYNPLTRECDQTHLIEELGDIEFYLEGLMQLYKVTQTAEALEWTGRASEMIENNNRLLYFAGSLLDRVKKEVIYDKQDPPALEGAIKNDICNFRRHLNLFINYRFPNMPTMAAVIAIRGANAQKLLTGKNARYSEGTYSNDAAQKRADKQGEE